MKNLFVFLVILLVGICRFASAVEVLNPISYGILSAKTGVERYNCLLSCHDDAVKRGVGISYSGIKTIDIEIPANAKSIPLPDFVDFAGVQISVLNTQKGMFLFAKNNISEPINLPEAAIDITSCLNEKEISSGNHLIVVEDGNAWVKNRKGYSYGATRKDILVIEQGRVKNNTTFPYSDSLSSPHVSIVKNVSAIKYHNLKFLRDAKSTKVTCLFFISNACDVVISNVEVTTPQDNNLYGDTAFYITNSGNVCMYDIHINGTYSQTSQYGYGIYLDNVALYIGKRIFSRARWGVFGTYNVNEATLRDCDINRFDIHCYGRDVRCYNCKFTDLYNQYSSVYGDVYYENCTFTNFIPVLIESSYNAYTPFDLTFKSCTFNLTAGKNYLMALSGLEEAHNSRPELSRKALPNITIKNCMVNLADDVKEWYIVNTGKVAYKDPLDYISKIEVNRLKINGNVDYKLFSTDLRTTQPLKVVRKRVKMIKK